MEILIDRDNPTRDYTFGKLYVDECFQCYTLEDPVRHIAADGSGKVWGDTAIPTGRYRVTYRWSEHFQRDMPHLESVPHFAQIMLHWGNKTKDTHGCPLVGLSRDFKTREVYSSRVAFDSLDLRMQAVLKTGGEVWCTVQN